MVPIMANLVRILLAGAALAIVSPFVAMLAEPFFSALLQEIGVDTSQWARPIVMFVQGLVAQLWFQLLATFIVGAALGTWGHWAATGIDRRKAKDFLAPDRESTALIGREASDKQIASLEETNQATKEYADDLRRTLEAVLTPARSREKMQYLDMIAISEIDAPSKQDPYPNAGIFEQNLRERAENLTDRIRDFLQLFPELGNDLHAQFAKEAGRVRGNVAYYAITEQDQFRWPSEEVKQQWHIVNAQIRLLNSFIATERKRLEVEAKGSVLNIKIPAEVTL